MSGTSIIAKISMSLNSIILTVRRVPTVEIRVLTSLEQCGDQSVCLEH